MNDPAETWDGNVNQEVGQAVADQTKILIKIREVGGPSPVDDMLRLILPELVEQFRSKARDYEADGQFTADALGSQGQFADIWRKILKLKAAMWDGKKLRYEGPEEILADLFGHTVLSINYLRSESILHKTKKAIAEGTLSASYENGIEIQ